MATFLLTATGSVRGRESADAWMARGPAAAGGPNRVRMGSRACVSATMARPDTRSAGAGPGEAVPTVLAVGRAEPVRAEEEEAAEVAVQHLRFVEPTRV